MPYPAKSPHIIILPQLAFRWIFSYCFLSVVEVILSYRAETKRPGLAPSSNACLYSPPPRLSCPIYSLTLSIQSYNTGSGSWVRWGNMP